MIAYLLPLFLVFLGFFLIYIKKNKFFGKVILFIGIFIAIASAIILHIKSSEINTRKYVALKHMSEEYPEINSELKKFYSDKKISNDEYLKIVLIVESKRKEFLDNISK